MKIILYASWKSYICSSQWYARVDITFIVGMLERFQKDHNKERWKVLKCEYKISLDN